MKNLFLIVPAAFLAACATTGQKPVTTDQLARELQALRQENQELKARLDAQPAQSEQAPVVREQAVPVQLVQQMGNVPPAQPILPGPPQNMGWAHTPPNGCESGPFRLIIRNWARGYYARMFIDGEEINFRLPAVVAPDGSMMTPIPPRFSGNDPTVASVCLNHLGEHTISGVWYGTRMGVLVEIGRFNENVQIDASHGGGYTFNLTDELL